MLVALAALALAAAPDPRLVVLDAMALEVERSTRLRLDDFEPPYFVGYQVRDVRLVELTGRSGALEEDRERRDRTIAVDVRVGSHELDSSGASENVMVLGEEMPAWTAPRDAPLDDDPAALRQALWLLTDERYKEALSAWFKRRSRDVYRKDDPDRPPSFTREPPSRHLDAPLPFTVDRDRWRRAVRDVTGGFRSTPHVFDARLRVSAEKQVRWLVTSEGTRLVTERALYAVHLQAVARAPDGQLLESGRDYYAATEAGLPDLPALRAAAREVASELAALQAAPVIDPYTGPALLEPEAAGVLFHEAVGHRLEGERLLDDKEGQTFKGQIGQPVLAPFLTIVDDPTLASAGGTALNGTYGFDDQGVPAQRTVLVREGTLETFLLSRRPVAPFTRSNGHARAQGARTPTARMSNLVVESARQQTRAQLKARLMEEARRRGRPYGLVIRDITGGNTNTATWGYQAFKGTPRLVMRVDAVTGEEQLVRGVELVGTPLASINKVLATGDEVRAFNGYCGAESGYVPVSTVAPAVLVGEIELQRTARAAERAPVLPSPWQRAPPPEAGR